MVGCDFADPAVLNQVETGIAHMADVQEAIFNDRSRKDASHPPPPRIAFREAKYFIVGTGNGFAQPARHRARCLVQPVSYGLDGLLGGDFARSLPPHPIGDNEYAPVVLAQNPVLVILSFFPGIRFPPSLPRHDAPRMVHGGHLERMSLT
jgi:hypothetical protein